MTRYKRTAGLAVLIASLYCAARGGGPGSSGSVALKLPTGARPTAMGGAFVGLADDANTLYWNPAGLATVGYPEISALHTIYLADTTYQSLGYAQPLGPLGCVAGALSMLNYGDIPHTQERDDGLYGGQFGNNSPMDLFINLGWGESLPPIFGMNRLKGGLTLKGAFQQLSGGTLVGLGVSGGALWDTPAEGLRFGTVVDNLGALTGRGRMLPLVWALGGSYGASLGKDFRAVCAVDTRVAVDTDMMVNAGMELTAFEYLMLRAGWRGGGAVGGPSMGLGLRYPLTWFDRSMIFKMDYALASYGELGSSQRFQLAVQLGGWVEAVRLGNVEATGERGELSLKWEGKGPAYQIYVRPPGEDKFSQLSDRPVSENHFMLTGLPPGKYALKVVTVDPYKPEWRGAVSPDIEVEIKPAPAPEIQPVTPSATAVETPAAPAAPAETGKSWLPVDLTAPYNTRGQVPVPAAPGAANAAQPQAQPPVENPAAEPPLSDDPNAKVHDKYAPSRTAP